MNSACSDDGSTGEYADHMQVARTKTDMARVADADTAIAAKLVERCIAVERRRNFKALCWICSTFFVVILAVAALLLSIGVSVLNISKNAEATAKVMMARTDTTLKEYGNTVENVASEVRSVQKKADRVSESLQADKLAYDREWALLQQDLESFGKWYSSRYAAMSNSSAEFEDIKTTLSKLEEAARGGAEKLAMLEERQERILAPLTPRPLYQTSGMKSTYAAVGGPETGTNAAIVPQAFDSATVKVGSTVSGAVTSVVYPDGSRYEGVVVNGKKEGSGTFTFSSGDKYTGDFKNDLRHGQGVYYYVSGDRYEGAFVDGKKHGQGIYYHANGDKFEGEFQDGRQNGTGIYMRTDGTSVTGLWRDDNLVIAN